jgi:hypothetical protein
VGGEEVGLALKDGVEAAVARKPSKQTLNHSPDPDGDKLAVVGLARRDPDMYVLFKGSLSKSMPDIFTQVPRRVAKLPP